ncbi:MAG TPA: hypothetical protein VLA75_11115 [Thermoanaerobaculia bacterium]|nr:hypothetical protein [Thermoanaerobaculia bacterium]
MPRTIHLAPLRPVAAGLLLAFLALPSPILAESPWRLDVELGPAWQTRNDFAVPGEGGTRLDLGDTGAVPAARVTLTRDLGERWSLRLLAAPLATETGFVSDREVDFDGTLFPAGLPLRQEFRFDSYRFSFFYRFPSEGPWSFRAGATGKVRSADIRIAGAGRSASRDDLGFVPLLYGGARYDAGGPFAFDAELDAAAASQGRAVDLSLRLELPGTARLRPYLGYRLLEGGADNEDVRTFATFHYLLAGARLRL